MRKFRFYILGLVHLPCSLEYMSCAFTQKNYKLAKMLLGMGHEVIYLGAEGSNLPCTEFIQTHTLKDICDQWGDGDNRFEIGYNWKETDFRHDFSGPRAKVTSKFYDACIEYINNNKKPDYFLLLSQGAYHKPISDKVGMFLTCEPGIGYRGSFCRFRAFESSYIQNFTYGSQHPFECMNGNYYDRVIPNYFENDSVKFIDHNNANYCLFIGRIIQRKGILTAYKACQAAGIKLVLAGQGGIIRSDGSLTNEYKDFVIPKGNWEYIGYVNVEQRKNVMGNALATFAPTEYLECFAGTHIESILHGTPVITTDFGVFPQTVQNGVNGYRCNTLKEFVKAIHDCKNLNRLIVRKSAEPYLVENVSKLYDKWFNDLYDLWESTVDKNKQGWHRL